jgi:hypothetical protein
MTRVEVEPPFLEVEPLHRLKNSSTVSHGCNHETKVYHE